MATYRRMFKDKDGNDIIPAGFLDEIYPVGSIYMSTTLDTATKVHNALGGTWEAWGAGRVPVGVDTSQTEFNTVGKTGGEKTHTITIDEMPNHQHISGRGFRNNEPTQSGNLVLANEYLSEDQWSTNKTSLVGGGQAHNNLQPYITCYMWKRIA